MLSKILMCDINMISFLLRSIQSWILTKTISAIGPVLSALPTPILYEARAIGDSNKRSHNADKLRVLRSDHTKVSIQFCEPLGCLDWKQSTKWQITANISRPKTSHSIMLRELYSFIIALVLQLSLLSIE